MYSLYRKFSRRGRRNSRDRDTTESTDSPRGRSKSAGGPPPRPPPPSAAASLKYATEGDQKESSNGEFVAETAVCQSSSCTGIWPFVTHYKFQTVVYYRVLHIYMYTCT